MIELDAITTLCLACVLYLIGQSIVNHVFLKRIFNLDSSKAKMINLGFNLWQKLFN